MKEDLRTQLDSYKRNNDEASKEALYSTINSISSPTLGYGDDTLNAIDEAKEALSTRVGNKPEIVQAIENVISTLE